MGCNLSRVLVINQEQEQQQQQQQQHQHQHQQKGHRHAHYLKHTALNPHFLQKSPNLTPHFFKKILGVRFPSILLFQASIHVFMYVFVCMYVCMYVCVSI